MIYVFIFRDSSNQFVAYKTNLNYVRKRPKNTLTMDDLEHEKDLEEDEFKTSAKPSTSRTMKTRLCTKNVVYVSNLHEDTDDFDDDQTGDSDNDGYSSPDIDYESLSINEENLIESAKIQTVDNKNEENISTISSEIEK